VGRGNYAPQLEDAAFSRTPAQGWSEPIVAQSGAGAVRVIERQSPRLATFDEMHDVLIQNLAQARGETAFEKWLQEQRDTRGVKIHDNVLELIGQPVS
jgi:parvulin-like peptidyl-prolyl isomerase